MTYSPEYDRRRGYSKGYRRGYGRRSFVTIDPQRGKEIFNGVKSMISVEMGFPIGRLMEWLRENYTNEKELRYAVGCVGGAFKELLREKMGLATKRERAKPSQANPT